MTGEVSINKTDEALYKVIDGFEQQWRNLARGDKMQITLFREELAGRLKDYVKLQIESDLRAIARAQAAAEVIHPVPQRKSFLAKCLQRFRGFMWSEA